MHTAVLHPTNMQKLIASTLDDGRSGVSAEDRSRWASVTASLQLSADQKSQILSLRQIFLRRMSKVWTLVLYAVRAAKRSTACHVASHHVGPLALQPAGRACTAAPTLMQHTMTTVHIRSPLGVQHPLARPPCR